MMGPLVLRVLLVQQVLLVPRVLPVPLALKVFKDIRVILVWRVLVDLQDLKVLMETLVEQLLIIPLIPQQQTRILVREI